MLKIIARDIKDLKPYERNARQHSAKQIGQIAGSISAFGFNNPILIDKKNMIIAGHGRWEAAKKLGMKEVPTLCLDHLIEDEVRAYILADNKLAELAGWDYEKPGTRLVRMHEGRKHSVLVKAEGFEYQGRVYSSLSKIANEITGKHWNGWVFFGLKN